MKAFLQLLLSLFGIIAKKPKEIEPLETPKKSPIEEYETEIEVTKIESKESEVKPVEFKAEELKDEYKLLVNHNLTLKSLIEDLNIYVNQEFKKTLTITMIFRTQEQQDYLYRNSAKYKKKKFKSPHQFWHSVDIRSRNFSAAEITQIEDYLNKKWNAKNYYKWTAKNHTVGSGLHFHIQFVKK